MDANILEASYQRVFGSELGIDEKAELFFKHFYEFFMMDQKVAQMFRRTDMAKQIRMMKRSFFKLLSYHVTREWSADLETMAKTHYELRVDPDMYDHWLNCVLKAVDDSDGEATAETLLAWRLALTPGVVYMKHWGEVYASRNVTGAASRRID